MRLDKLLSNLGYGSRREVKQMVSRGWVTINGDIARNEAQNVNPIGLENGTDAVGIHDEPIDRPDNFVVALNKPSGYVCSHDPKEGLSAYEFLDERWLARNPRLESIGRLDRLTTGLILFTNDHQMVHRLTSPKHHISKTYIATLDCEPDRETQELFVSGELMLEGERTPCLPVVDLTQVESTKGLPTYSLTIVEGRYHQVRRMFAAVGSHVEELERTQFGPISVESLDLGHIRVLNEDEFGLLSKI